MCESLPKEFEKTTEVLPFTKYGLSTAEEFRSAEDELQHQEWLKKAGLTNEELVLYKQNEAGLLDQRKKIESGVLKNQLEIIYSKISKQHCEKVHNDQPGTSTEPENLSSKLPKTPITFYPEGHPMNELKEIEESLFGHLKPDMLPITKRRKILRRLERKKERLLLQEKQMPDNIPSTSKTNRPGSLWDVKEIPTQDNSVKLENPKEPKHIIGPKQRTSYTIKDGKIVRLEPTKEEQEYRAVDIVVPVNAAEAQLLEGTKMSVDDIRKIERFKDYEPGTPSKVLYLKNIAPSVTQEQLSVLLIQFVLVNGAPVDVRLMSGRMQGQAFVAFQNEEVAIQALEEINGTILSGRPIIAQFGRNTNRIQPDDHR